MFYPIQKGAIAALNILQILGLSEIEQNIQQNEEFWFGNWQTSFKLYI